MGVQLSGNDITYSMFNEAAFATVPGSPSGERMYFVKNGLTGAIEKVLDETLNGRRGDVAPVDGAIDASGAIECTLAPESCPRFLRHAIGLSSTTYAVARKTTALITGVEVLRAETLTTAGNGTLAYTTSGTTITWAPSGDTAGTPVNIGAGGDFTVTSTGGLDLFIRVTAALLPGSNQNDTVAVSATTVYEHLFTPRGTLTEGMLIQADLGAKITTGANRFVRFLGSKIGAANFNFPANGLATVSYDMMAGNFNHNSGADLDGTLDDYGHDAFSMREAAFYIDGAAFAKGTSATVKYDNMTDGDTYTLGGVGARSALTHTGFRVTGTIDFLMTDEVAALVVAAIAGTSKAIKIELLKGTGAGTAGAEALIFRLPDLKFKAKTANVDGRKGQRVQLEFQGFMPASAETRADISLRTTRAAASI